MTSSPKSKSIAELATRGWVSLAQFAIIADMSYPTALKMKNEGKVEVIKVGGINRVYSNEVHRFLVKGNKTEGEGINSPHLSSDENDD